MTNDTTSRFVERKGVVQPSSKAKLAPTYSARQRMGLEGLVSKHRDGAYRGGRCNHWVKVKNPGSPAMARAKEVDWSR